MNRRTLLRALAATALCSLGGFVPRALAGRPQGGPLDVMELPAIPILMFHKVDDTPRYPEDISSSQLAALLEYAWSAGFRPVNMSDILEGRVDDIVPRGMKPLGITADDAHRSIIFSRATARHAEQRNARSFVEIFAQSVQKHQCPPRATFFISSVGDDRYSGVAGGYFGDSLPLADVLDSLAIMPGLELGYHTRTHARMAGMGAAEVRALLEDQMRQFHALGVLDRIKRILAYPYGQMPTEQGVYQLAEMGFKGGVLAFPGVREARYDTVPRCVYDGKLMTDAFRIPRVCIGAFTYAYKTSARAGAYAPIDPLEDFRKDVEAALPPIYVSRGPKN